MDPKTKKQNNLIEDNDIEASSEDEIEVSAEEYENLFFVPSEDETEELCEIAKFYAEY